MIGLALLESLPDGLPNRKSYVYSINDPRTGQPVYFGKTAKSPRIRLGQHRRDSEYDSCPLYDWWRSVAAEGLEPVMSVLIECDSDLESRVMEAAIIGLCRLAGLPILNVSKGGDGKAQEEHGRCREHGEYAPWNGCVACKRKWREANPDYYRKWCAENRERRAESIRKWREANRERIAETNRRWSEANRERRSEQQRARRAKKKAEKLASTQARTEPTA